MQILMTLYFEQCNGETSELLKDNTYYILFNLEVEVQLRVLEHSRVWEYAKWFLGMRTNFFK